MRASLAASIRRLYVSVIVDPTEWRRSRPTVSGRPGLAWRGVLVKTRQNKYPAIAVQWLLSVTGLTWPDRQTNRQNASDSQWSAFHLSLSYYLLLPRNKKLSRCWDSETCEPLDAKNVAIKVQNSTFFILHHAPVLPAIKLGITRYKDPGTDLSCHVPSSFHFLLHYVITLHHTITYRQTGGQTVVMLDVAQPRMACRAKKSLTMSKKLALSIIVTEIQQ